MSEYKGNGLKDTIMRFWIKRRDNLVTDYSLVGYMLSPNPKIMAHCAVNKSSLHVDSADRLIEKLIDRNCDVLPIEYNNNLLIVMFVSINNIYVE
jgi:hypothetical protein